MSFCRLLRITAAFAAAAVLTMGAAASLASAAPGTVRVLDLSAPSLGRSISVAAPGGGTFSADPGRALVRVTTGQGATSQVAAWCVDRTRSIDEGINYPVNLQTPADTPELTTTGYREAGWLIAASDGLITGASDSGFEAAAIQVAVWQLAGQAADVVAVTANPALNTRVAQLRALAAGKALGTTLALSGPAGAITVGSPASVTVSGAPGASVDLTVTSGSAALSRARVTLGSSGTAQIGVTPAAAGGITVGATSQGGALMRAVHPSGAKAPQGLAWVTPAPLSASVNLTAVAPTVAPLVTPASVPVTTAPVVAAQVPATLQLAKSAPARLRRGRAITYTLTVTNVSAQAARGVVVRDPVPAATVLGLLPKGARLSSGAVVWSIGALAPGKSVTVHLRLRTINAPLGDVVNVASASAANAATVRARARTRLFAPRVAPAAVAPVTG